ncbi:TonB-dependent siderophore receptor [Nitratireductor sp. ZSWI3]|uniref:TonB-dependent receptor plug domain-containing protein n=1 Tax=Nitratireductor sp. ZSWI3 TaxID=2966359 RepID=UPI00215005AB|nr:TonB-dependent receptor [Nitratireductor sp. ZSWI3]MCR4268218.1 TonB-dependent receptor [Nitratireductor sp. ZSWI3]
MLSRQGSFPYLLGASTVALTVSIHPAPAQDLDLGTIVVTPNRAPTDRAKVGSSVAVIDRREIEQQSLPVIVEYLDLLPGVSISSPGGRGAEGSLSVRGAPRRYVKTLFNGIDISDPTNTQVQTSYQYLLSGGIERAEVLKGSQSTLYGSDAIAGVISLSTLGDIEPGLTHIVQGEGGSHGSLGGSYGLRAADDRSKLSLNLTGFRTDGISSAASGTERDGYENLMFDVNAEHVFSDVFSVFGSALYIDAEAEFDNDSYVFPAGVFNPPTDNLTATNLSKQLAGRAGFNLDLLDGRFRNTFSAQTFDLKRSIAGTTFDGTYEGKRYKVDYQGAYDVTDWLTIQAGADYEKQKALFPEGAFNPEVNADFNIAGFWGEAIATPIENLTLTAGIRHDEHSEFGGHTTYRATGSYLFADTDTRLHASLGTGFRAPSLNELFGPFGADPNLTPETSFGFDAGIEQRFLAGRLVADLTYFQMKIDDLITYSGGYTQLPGTARQRGVEASLTYAVNDWLEIGGAYTYTSSVDQNGDRLTRIPRHAIALQASARPAEKWLLSASAKANIDTLDGNDFELDDHFLLNAKLAYKPTEDTELYLRAENLLDQDYQTVRGFNTPGLSVFAGFRARFGP